MTPNQKKMMKIKTVVAATLMLAWTTSPSIASINPL